MPPADWMLLHTSHSVLLTLLDTIWPPRQSCACNLTRVESRVRFAQLPIDSGTYPSNVPIDIGLPRTTWVTGGCGI